MKQTLPNSISMEDTKASRRLQQTLDMQNDIFGETLQPDQLETLVDMLNTSLIIKKPQKKSKSTSAKATARQAKKKDDTFFLSKRDEEILRAVNHHHYLLLDHIVKLFFQPGVKNYVREQLKRLTDAGYMFRFLKPTTHLGPKPYIYTLGSKGIAYLKEQNEIVDLRFRPSEMKERHYFTVLHDIQVSDFLTAATLLPRAEPIIELAAWEHAWQIKRDPLITTAVVERQGKKLEEKITVVADAWLDFRFVIEGTKYQTALWFELDRGSEHQKQFKQKIRHLLLAMSSEAYKKRFGTDIFLIAFATPRGKKRVDIMRSWTMQELIAINKKEYAKLFFFTDLPHEMDEKTGEEKEDLLELDPKILFLSPVWKTAEDETPVSLLTLT